MNLVTPALFSRFPTLEAFAAADVEEVEQLIKSCGFYHTKARDIVAFSKMLLDENNGGVPDTIEALVRLPGVGRKTANLIVGDVYHKPAVVCDTHCIRITNLLGLADSKDPLKAEKQLRACLPMREASDFCHRLVLHGREVCRARKPQCSRCVMFDICLHSPDKKVARRNAK